MIFDFREISKYSRHSTLLLSWKFFEILVTEMDNTNLQQPDDDTKERIKNLAIVGTTIAQGFSAENQDVGDNFMLAREALLRFQEGIDKLELDPPSKQGMLDLINYLQRKLDKRERGQFG